MMASQNDAYEQVTHNIAESDRLASRLSATIAHLKAHGQAVDTAEQQQKRHVAMAEAYRAHKKMLEERILARRRGEIA
jgi:lactam utilization protein B